MNLLVLHVFFLLGVCFAEDPEVTMNATELIRYWGYEAEEHNVTTEDGWILHMQRIPHGKSGPGKDPRPVMFLQHGLECASTNWLTNLPDQSAGYIFADAGFDVWLGNFRGNVYAMTNINASLTNKQRCSFSWDEMAKYDLPAMINYVVQYTGQKQLYYTGHSEGTMTAFAQLSQDTDFSSKIKRFFALGPVARVKHVQGLLDWIHKYFTWLMPYLGQDCDFLSSDDWLLQLVAKDICGWTYLENTLCSNIMFLIAGPNSDQLNKTRIPVYLSHTPAGTSMQNIRHFNQQIGSGNFQAYDYGDKEINRQHYGSPTAPLYNISEITTPTYLFYGEKDWLADPTDVKEGIIPYLQMTGDYAFLLPDFNHLDFIWGMRANNEVYQKVLSIIKTEDGI